MNAMMDDAEKNPEKILQAQHAFSDGEMVAVHSKVKQNTGDAALVHVFQFHKYRIVELRDIGHTIL